MFHNLRELLKKLLRKGRPADPPREPEPYAPVPVPKKPKRPHLSGAVALAEPEDD